MYEVIRSLLIKWELFFFNFTWGSQFPFSSFDDPKVISLALHGHQIPTFLPQEDPLSAIYTLGYHSQLMKSLLWPSFYTESNWLGSYLTLTITPK